MAPEINAHQAGHSQAARPDLNQFLRFALGRDNYAVRIDDIREILQITQMTPLPLMPDFVRGVMNLRGSVVPVIDLSARLGLVSFPMGKRSCVVMVDIRTEEDGLTTLGMLVDAVHEVFDADASLREDVPRFGTRINPEFIKSMVKVRGQTTAEIDLSKVLSRPDLTQLIALHQAH